MTYVGRAIGLCVLCVLCVLVGLFLERIGITADGMLTDTWHTVGSLFHKIANFFGWSLPYALLGAIVVVPVTLLSPIARWRHRRR